MKDVAWRVEGLRYSGLAILITACKGT
jgi:hypothetical protein